MADPVISKTSEKRDGVTYTVYKITEDETTGVADDIELPCVRSGTITLVVADLLDGGGGGLAATIQPAFGRSPAFVASPGSPGFIDQADAAAASVYVDQDKRFDALDKGAGSDAYGILILRSQPDVALTGDQFIETSVTVREGH